MASLHVRLLPYVNGNANMAYTYDMDGSVTDSISERQEKKKNLLLDPIEKRLLRKENKAPASKFIKRQDKLKKLLDNM